MSDGNKNSRSILRLLFWEGMALAGLLHTRLYPIADHLWEMNFLYNAIFFLAAYPILYVYRWKLAGGCLSLVMWPLGFVLGWALGASCYLWLAYVLLFARSPYFYAMSAHWPVLGFLFAFIYFPLLQPFLGVSRKYHSLGDLVWLLAFSGAGCLAGLLAGRMVDAKFGSDLALHGLRFLLWLGLILLGTAVGALVGQRRAQG